MMPNLTLTIAQYAAATSIDKIPPDVRELAKQVILDEMASAQFGRRSLAGDLAARYALSQGGAPEALVLGTRVRIPAQYAALANGAAGHGEEVDGAHVVGGHPGATLVHAAVAAAERQRCSGAELLNAVVLAYDVGVRLVAACGGKFSVRSRLHLYSDFLYALGGAVAAGRLMGLEPLHLCHAMALCTFQTNALGSLFQERRHISKSLCNGQFALAGVSAAQMAAVGLEGVDDVVGAHAGVLDAWGAKDGAALVTRGLGEDWSIRGANFKFINAGYPIHAAVEAARTLQQRHHLAADTIKAVHVGMPREGVKTVDNRAMHNICVQDMVCAALAQGGLSLRELPFPSILQDPVFNRLRAAVTVGVDPDLDRSQPQGRGANVLIQTADGLTISHCVEAPRGHSSRGRVTWTELEDKWRDGLPGCDVGKMVGLAQRLDDIDDVRVFADAFAQ
jgi:2-methylcitrate dehydratase PrpD